MKRLQSLTLLLVLFLTGCKAPPPSAPATAPAAQSSSALMVFAAASLTDAFTEIGETFEAAHPGVKITFNFAGSQSLQTQIQEGAPADVFASANMQEMDALVAGGFIAQDAPQVFLANKLVVILPANNPANLDKLEDLARPDIKLVLAAEEVPVGRYARQMLDQLNGQFGSDFKDKVIANVVSNEDNVRQVLAKVQLGEADAGIVYASDAVTATDLQIIEIPDELNVIAKYPIAPLRNSANAELAAQFVAYILSPEGQFSLGKWGFGPIE